MDKITVYYNGDPWDYQHHAKLTNFSSIMTDKGRVITFKISWGGFLGMFKKTRTYKSNPIADIAAMRFQAWPRSYDITSEATLRWRDTVTGNVTVIGTDPLNV